MAIHFDGSSQYLSNASYTQPSYPFSMSCWFIADQNTSYDVAFCMSDGSNEEHSVGYAGNLGGEPLYVLTRTSAGVSYASFGGTISTATWHNGVGVWASANSRQAFLDGAAQTAATQTATLTNGQVGIGRSLRSAGTYWDGKVAECAMWDIALPQQAIDSLAAGASPLLIYPQNLIDYWPLWSTSTLKSMAGRHTLLSATGVPTNYDHPRIVYPGSPTIVLAATGGLQSVEYTASGGATSGGAATFVRGSVMSAAGGAQAGGAATFLRGLVMSADGGAQTGGAADFARGVLFASSGGGQSGGAATMARGAEFTSDGGAQAGGAGTFVRGVVLQSSGGASTGGAATFVINEEEVGVTVRSKGYIPTLLASRVLH